MNKVCQKCKIEKHISEFSTYEVNHKYGQCKKCVSIENKSYYDNNKEQRISYAKSYREDNRIQMNEKSRIKYQTDIEYREKNNSSNKKYKEENKEYLSKYQKEYLSNLPDEEKQRRLENRKIYLLLNKDTINSKRREYQRNKRLTDAKFNLEKTVSNTIRLMLKKNSSSKSNRSCREYLAYSFEELKEHIEVLFSHSDNLTQDGKVWMNWQNRGKYDPKSWNDNDPSTWKWQLDHIKPHSDFAYTSMDCEEFRQCWALSNLRPLSAKQNYLDGIYRKRHRIK